MSLFVATWALTALAVSSGVDTAMPGGDANVMTAGGQTVRFEPSAHRFKSTTSTTSSSTSTTSTSTTSTTAAPSTTTTTALLSSTSSTSTSSTSTSSSPIPSSALWVSPSGSDTNSGSATSPFRTLQKGLTSVRPGGQLVVHGGTYDERIKSPTITAGRPDAPILVRAAPGERPVVSGLLWLKGASYWTIDGINVTWSSLNVSSEHMVKFTDGVGWRYTNSEVWGAHSYAGILVAGAPSDWLLDHLYVHDTYASNGTNQDHLIYVNAGTNHGHIAWNVLANSSNGRAIKVGPASSTGAACGNLLVDHNTMLNNLGPSNIQLAWNTSNVTVTSNIMDLSGANRTSVTAYQLTGSGNIVTDNIWYRSTGAADNVAGIVSSLNIKADPMYADAANGDYRTTNPVAATYGAFAPGR